MDRAQLYKLTELIVAEVVRRIAQEERRRQHPEQVLVLLADSVSFPEKLQQTLNEQFGVAYTPVSIPETNTFADEALLYAGKLEPGGLLERVKEAKTVILVSPRLELLRRIASGDDGDRLNGRGVQAREISQLIVLVVRHRRPDLLDREHAAGQVYEAHNVAGNAAGQCRE